MGSAKIKKTKKKKFRDPIAEASYKYAYKSRLWILENPGFDISERNMSRVIAGFTALNWDISYDNITKVVEWLFPNMGLKSS